MKPLKFNQTVVGFSLGGVWCSPKIPKSRQLERLELYANGIKPAILRQGLIPIGSVGGAPRIKVKLTDQNYTNTELEGQFGYCRELAEFITGSGIDSFEPSPYEWTIQHEELEILEGAEAERRAATEVIDRNAIKVLTINPANVILKVMVKSF